MSNTVYKLEKQPTYKRQQFLLALIQRIGERLTATELQKIVFLYTKNSGTVYYDFVPYKYGPYSFQLAQDIEVMSKDGYLTAYNELAEPKKYVPVIAIDDIAIEKWRSNALVREAYKRYPYYAIRSEIAGKVLDNAALQAVQDVNRELSKNTQKLFSIGYEGKSVENFLNILLQNGIRLLCDVRKNPLSRKFGFSKNKLQHVSKSVGISYTHIPELGIESSERQVLETREDYAALFSEYRESLSFRAVALQQVYALFQSNARVALMCYEQAPSCCHRTIIKEYLVENYHVKSEDLTNGT